MITRCSKWRPTSCDGATSGPSIGGTFSYIRTGLLPKYFDSINKFILPSAKTSTRTLAHRPSLQQNAPSLHARDIAA